MIDKIKEEIKEVLKEEKKQQEGFSEKDFSNDWSLAIHQGWIEALEYALGVIDRKVAEESLTRDVAIKRCIDKLKKDK